jgi:membrane associated rhomboid family serine protease
VRERGPAIGPESRDTAAIAAAFAPETIEAVQTLIDLTQGAPVSAMLLAVIVAVSLIGLYRMPAWIERNLLRPYWLMRRSEYATLVTSGFIHADIAHLLFNGFTLWAFAFPLERTIGSVRFLLLYAAGLLVSSFGTWLKHRDDPEYRSLGASGAILAVLFASIVYFPTNAIYILPIPVPIPAPLFAVGYLAYTVYASRQARGRINHDAHLSGALTGLAFVAITDPQAVARAIRAVFG